MASSSFEAWITGTSAAAVTRIMPPRLAGGSDNQGKNLRDERRIDDEILRTLLRHLDLEEAAAEHPEQ
jgi:monovalent cation/hydrogen antiporter